MKITKTDDRHTANDRVGIGYQMEVKDGHAFNTVIVKLNEAFGHL